jgi:ABC-type antimicrobial peptide transport system permease subunit
MIFADGLRVGLIGIVPGVILAFAAGRALRALLFGVAPNDPATFTVAVAVALVITFAGALVPAVRALRVNPISVLRAE